MNIKHHRTTTGIAAAVVIGLLVLVPLDAAAARQSPDRNVKPHPSTVDTPCPAIDTEPVCGLVALHPTNGGGDRPGRRTLDATPADDSDVVIDGGLIIVNGQIVGSAW